MEIKKIKIGGMSCANCAKGIELQLQKKGFNRVSVDFSTAEGALSKP